MKISIPSRIPFETIKDSKYIKSFKRFIQGNKFTSFFAITIASIIILGFSLIPTWFYLGIRFLIGPEGFWQEFALFAISMIVIGWLQAIMLIIGCYLIFLIIFEETSY